MIEAQPLDKSKSQASLGRSLMRLGDDWRGYIILGKRFLSGSSISAIKLIPWRGSQRLS